MELGAFHQRRTRRPAPRAFFYFALEFPYQGIVSNPSVIIVGAGLAGLVAARILQRRGCTVSVFEARERIGGRVWTRHDGFGGMHGEAGGELIDADQKEIRNLARELGLSEQRILRGGFVHYRLGQDGRRRIRSARSGWQATESAIAPLVKTYKTNEQEWDGPIAEAIARRSVGDLAERDEGGAGRARNRRNDAQLFCR